jgi:hypothetical protein
MEIVPLTSLLYKDWNEFCNHSDEAWFWHTPDWLEYILRYRPESSPQSFSFMVQQDNEILAACPLVLEASQDKGEIIPEFAYGGDPCPLPALRNGIPERQRKKVLGVISEHIDSLARQSSVYRIRMRESPPAPSFWRSHPRPLPDLLRCGYLDISGASQVIDLSAGESDLFDAMRKGHRCDLKRSRQMLEISVYDASNITEEMFDQYRELHQIAAGRVTRPLVTFEMMYGWVQSGLAALIAARHNGAIVGSALFSIYKDGAYYSSSCEHPEARHLPIGHATQWAAICWLKQRGIRWYEVGIQPHGMQPHGLLSPKELGISLFKRGFGGITVPYWIGEKFYCKDFYLKVTGDRQRRYVDQTFLPEQTEGFTASHSARMNG